jgi:hypothetical protein
VVCILKGFYLLKKKLLKIVAKCCSKKAINLVQDLVAVLCFFFSNVHEWKGHFPSTHIHKLLVTFLPRSVLRNKKLLSLFQPAMISYFLVI